MFHNICAQVTSHFHKVVRVIVLTELPMTSLKSDSDLQDFTVVTRSLNTSRSPKNEAHVLEQPNILTGIAAACEYSMPTIDKRPLLTLCD